MSRKATYASAAEKQRAYRERQKAKRNGTPVTLAEGGNDADLATALGIPTDCPEDPSGLTGFPRAWALTYGVEEGHRLASLARQNGIPAAMAEANRLLDLRKKKPAFMSDATLLNAALKDWRTHYEPEVVEQLLAVAAVGGLDASLYAASAVRRALDWERSWQALRDWDATMQGYQLKALVKRKDPRVVKFLEECRLC